MPTPWTCCTAYQPQRPAPCTPRVPSKSDRPSRTWPHSFQSCQVNTILSSTLTRPVNLQCCPRRHPAPTGRRPPAAHGPAGPAAWPASQLAAPSCSIGALAASSQRPPSSCLLADGPPARVPGLAAALAGAVAVAGGVAVACPGATEAALLDRAAAERDLRQAGGGRGSGQTAISASLQSRKGPLGTQGRPL